MYNNIMIVSVHQPQYIPWLGYFDKIAHSDSFVFLEEVQYKPREYQNRNRIRTKDGSIWLTVPVISKGKGRQRICDVGIDNEFDWRRQHLLSLQSFYGHARFFDKFFPFFEDTFKRQWEKLNDLNLHIINFMLKELSINTSLFFDSKLGITKTKTERIIEICNKLNADTYLSGAGGRVYLEEEKFSKAGIKLIYQDYKHPVYHQQYMKNSGDFLPFMSTIDLLFNEGLESRSILG
ncbi:MAG: WbqC family protein [Candidatus Omnitrophica bacterium]|nr:WbqC family protein [Candidatus Omnitrophota bacterium]